MATELVVIRLDARAEAVADEINREHKLAQQTAGTAVEHAVRCGELLLSVKRRLKHGEFLPWVEKHCEFTRFTAAKYMKASKANVAGAHISSLAKLLGGDSVHVSHNSGENEWYTPPDIIERARRAMGGIDLDPASSELANVSVKAATYFTGEQDGLAQEWRGRVWMNPPYAQPLCAQFCEQITARYKQGKVSQACVLVNNATETAWFQPMLAAATAVCFPAGRVKFVGVKGNAGSPLQGQAILYFGNRTRQFRDEFSSMGEVLSHG